MVWLRKTVLQDNGIYVGFMNKNICYLATIYDKSQPKVWMLKHKYNIL